MNSIWKLRKRICKTFARLTPSNGLRIFLWRCAGYSIGEEVYIGEDLIIIDELEDKGFVTIGDRVAFAERVTLVVSSYPNNSRILPYINKVIGPVTIKEDAWLGTGCIILPNVTIGKGAVIGAGSVVIRDVPDYTVVVGAPARQIRKLNVNPVNKAI